MLEINLLERVRLLSHQLESAEQLFQNCYALQAVEMAAEPKRVGQQLKVASKKGFPLALVIGSDEFAAGTAQCKLMQSQQSAVIEWHGDLRVLVDAVRSQLEAIRTGR